MNYLAACEDNDCATFEPLSDRVWFKISEDGFSHMGSYKGEDGQDIRVPRFGSDALALEHDNSWTVNIPEGLRPGEYLLRHEFGEPIYFIFYELFWLIRAHSGASLGQRGWRGRTVSSAVTAFMRLLLTLNSL